MSDDTTTTSSASSPQASRDELREAAYRERGRRRSRPQREKKGVTERAAAGATASEVARGARRVERARPTRSSASATTRRLDARDGRAHDDDVDDRRRRRRAAGAEVQLTGWRKLHGPPPPKAAGGAVAANGKAARPHDRAPPTRADDPAPAGHAARRAAAARAWRCCSTSPIVLVIYCGRPARRARRDPERLPDKVDQIDQPQRAPRRAGRHRRCADVDQRRRQGDRAGAGQRQQRRPPGRAVRQGVGAEGPEVGAEGLRRRRRRTSTARTASRCSTTPTRSRSSADKLGDDIQGTQYGSYLVMLVLALLYLVPTTAITGRTLGMRGRKIRIVRVDGSPVGWYGRVRALLHPDPIRSRWRSRRSALGPLIGLGHRPVGLPRRERPGRPRQARPDDRRRRVTLESPRAERDRSRLRDELMRTCTPSRRARRSRSTCSGARAPTSPR